MNPPQPTTAPPPCPSTCDSLREQLHHRLDEIIASCLTEHAHSSFFAFEKAAFVWLASLGCLLVRLFLLHRHHQLDLDAFGHDGRYRLADDYAERDLHTPWGIVRYGRAYLCPTRNNRGAPGVHPLDAELGLTRDAFSPWVISAFCRLATRASFRLARSLGGMFLGWAPSATAIQEWAQGLGRPAYVWLSTGPVPTDDGEVLVVECDGKAIPTATAEELAKRRRPHQDRPCDCKCQRHRGHAKRQAGGKKKRRKRGDKSKNGKSATLVVLYTLKRGADGRLHGPCNKKAYGSFSSRKQALAWARQQATRRGFGPETTKVVQLVVDGESCLEKQLRKLFPNAIITLDIRHVQERLWKVGRQLHAEGSAELAAWVGPLVELLVEGKVAELLEELRRLRFKGPGSPGKRKVVEQALGYLQKRQGMMDYGTWRAADLVLASGVVEGAARHVIGERLDQSGMRWIVERAEAVLLLRCIEVNGDWDAFFAFTQQQHRHQMRQGQPVRIRSKVPTQRPERNPVEKRRQRQPDPVATAHPAEVAA